MASSITRRKTERSVLGLVLVWDLKKLYYAISNSQLTMTTIVLIIERSAVFYLSIQQLKIIKTILHATHDSYYS